MSNIDLTEAMEAVREGWPGHHFTRDGSLFEAPPVRDDGATARLIEYAIATAAPLIEAQVLAQVAAKIDALAVAMRNSDGWDDEWSTREVRDALGYAAGIASGVDA